MGTVLLKPCLELWMDSFTARREKVSKIGGYLYHSFYFSCSFLYFALILPVPVRKRKLCWYLCQQELAVALWSSYPLAPLLEEVLAQVTVGSPAACNLHQWVLSDCLHNEMSQDPWVSCLNTGTSYHLRCPNPSPGLQPLLQEGIGLPEGLCYICQPYVDILATLVYNTVQEASTGQLSWAKDASSHFTFTNAVLEMLGQWDNSGHARCKQSSDTYII